MAKAKQTLTAAEQVDAHIAQLPEDIAPIVAMLRKVILDSHTDIAEHIKWNNPAFHYTGPMAEFDPKEYKRDIAVFNLFKGRVMLVLPSGARLNDPHKILEGKYADGRRTIVFKDMTDATAKADWLRELMQEWVATVDK